MTVTRPPSRDKTLLASMPGRKRGIASKSVKTRQVFEQSVAECAAISALILLSTTTACGAAIEYASGCS